MEDQVKVLKYVCEASEMPRTNITQALTSLVGYNTVTGLISLLSGKHSILIPQTPACSYVYYGQKRHLMLLHILAWWNLYFTQETSFKPQTCVLIPHYIYTNE